MRQTCPIGAASTLRVSPSLQSGVAPVGSEAHHNRRQRDIEDRIIAPRRSNSAHLHRPRRAICATAKASLACAASSRILAAAPGRCGSQPKISKTTRCKVAGGRRQGRFGPILDTSGKSTALLHHRTIRETPAGLVERLAKPRLEHGDLGFGRRHVFRPVIRHSRCHRSALRPSMARTSGRGQIVIDIVEFAMLPVGPGKCTLRRRIIGVP